MIDRSTDQSPFEGADKHMLLAAILLTSYVWAELIDSGVRSIFIRVQHTVTHFTF